MHVYYRGVGDNKMTKATFRQIQENNTDVLSVDGLLGWVYDNGIVHVLWENSGKLYVRAVDRYERGRYTGHTLDGETINDYKDICGYIKKITDSCDQLFIAT